MPILCQLFIGESLEFMRPVYSRWKSRLHGIPIVKKGILSDVEFGIYYGHDPVDDASAFKMDRGFFQKSIEGGNSQKRATV